MKNMRNEALEYLSKNGSFSWKKSYDILDDVFDNFPDIGLPAISEDGGIVNITWSTESYLLTIEVSDIDVYVFGYNRKNKTNYDSVEDWVCKGEDVKPFIGEFLKQF